MRKRQRDNTSRERLEDAGLLPLKMEEPLEAGKDEEKDPPLEPPEGAQPSRRPDFRT